MIDQLTTTFDPTKYTDDYRTALLELIESKKAGQTTITAKTKEPVSNNVTDLMEALQASIDRTKHDEPQMKKTTRKKVAPKKRNKLKQEAERKTHDVARLSACFSKGICLLVR